MMVVVMVMMRVMMECGMVGLVVTDEPKGPILCWTWPLTHILNLKSL